MIDRVIVGNSVMGTSLRRRAVALVGFGLVYNLIEAVVAITFGLEADSISLLGFGLDSVIELVAASVLLWRLLEQAGEGDDEFERRERLAMRFIGVTFLALALYVSSQSALDLWWRRVPEASVVGMVVAGLSLLVMPALAVVKIRVARRLGSRALEMEARETLACAWLSLVLLAGLGLNALWGLWWADPVAALLMVPWLVREGMEGLEGEACGACQTGESTGE